MNGYRLFTIQDTIFIERRKSPKGEWKRVIKERAYDSYERELAKTRVAELEAAALPQIFDDK